jgi:hypothetical protein
MVVAIEYKSRCSCQRQRHWPSHASSIRRIGFSKHPFDSHHQHIHIPSIAPLPPGRTTDAMGNDGGSIPTRRELVKEAARDPTTTEIKQSQNERQEYAWSTDPITRKPLSPPVVSDSNGKLYNKESIIEYLLPSDDATTTKADADSVLLGSVKSLKDVVEIKFDIDTNAAKDNKNPWKCPVTGERLGPAEKAVYLVPCGHAFSATAIKEVSGERCVTCDQEYASNDIIPILPTTPEDIARLSLRVKTLKEKGLAHSLKKAAKESKKRKKREEADEAPALVPVTDHKEANNINNSSTAALTAKVLLEEQEAKKRRMNNDNLKTLFSSRDQSKPIGKSRDFMTRGYDIPAGAKR